MSNTNKSSTSSDPATSPVTPRGNESETLPVLPLPDGVVFPEMVITVAIQSDEARSAVDAARTDRLLMVPKLNTSDDESSRYARIGVIGRIEDRGELPDGTSAITVRATHRARVGAGVIGATSGLWVEAEHLVDPPATADQETAAVAYRAVAATLLDKIGGRRMTGALRDIEHPGALADSIAYWPELSLDRRVLLLEAVDVDERLILATSWIKEALADLDLREKIAKEVSDGLDKGQREALLRRQLTAIHDELGEGDGDVIAEYRTKLDNLVRVGAVSDAIATDVDREISRLERTGGESMEANWIRTWLDTVFELPFAERSNAPIDLDDARSILDSDHTGLEDVKDRLIEYLAVRKLRVERSNEAEHSDDSAKNNPEPGASAPPMTNRRPGGRRNGAILALVGPPGVGKTSLGESVAHALGRSFVRVALGGVRDEAEIRGHRRTYVGARPGRLVRALNEAGTMNPVILLDEIDKVSGGYQGDPSAALLEVLDPAQNHSFRDHYLEFELDLSDVVFLATANLLDTIPAPLLDRMEVIRLDGYTEREKATIAQKHLVPKIVEQNGLAGGEVSIDNGAITTIAGDYTREAGVRSLERLIDKAVRKAATKLATGSAEAPITITSDDLRELLGRPIPSEKIDQRLDRPGIATGLAVTGAGGDVLFVETALIDGDGETVLTGQLGDVMKESASIARSVVGANTEGFGVEFPIGKRLHVHFPAGAIPKDGPSAGVTMTTALVSLLSGRPVKPSVGMTGEVTLQGRVLPIGGVKQKVLAAHRAGLTEVILPIANGDDLEDVPTDVLDQLTIHLAEDVTQVLDWALSPPS